jgi:molybdopterin-guanine dinucleotide biosynthesis protein A
MMKPLVGIFVGGKATRFGGVAKGMLPAPDSGEPIVARLARLCRDTVDADVVLVGRGAAYDGLGLSTLDDAPVGVGPLGGLSALLAEATRRKTSAIALAGDLPYVTSSMVARVAAFAPRAPAVAPRQSGVWQPLFARYDPVTCTPLIGAAIAERSFRARAVLEKLGDRAIELPLDATEAALLKDWDRPEDVKP